MSNISDAMLAQQLLAQEAAMLRESFPQFLHYSFATLNQGSHFLPNWHVDALCDYLQAVERGQVKRLLINMPPRYLKSLTVSVAWPAWLLGQQPHRRIIAASYAEKLSIKHSLDCRLLLDQPWYKRSFESMQVLSGQNEKHKFVSSQQGFRLATSVGGTLTGEGGDYLIIDDPINPLNAESQAVRNKANRWFEHTFSSRLNDKKNGAMVVVMQRLHEDDLSGHLLKKSGWELLSLPAIAPRTIWCNHQPRYEGEALHPEREDIHQLNRLTMEMGSHVFSAQYQQQPRPKQGAMVRQSWLVYSDKPPTQGQIVQSWDTAIKAGAANDPSVCITAIIHDNQITLLEVLRERLEYHQLRAAMLARAEKWQPSAILVEDKASGQSLLQDLRADSNLPLIPIMPKLDKLTRFAAITPMIEAGRMILPRTALWLDVFEAELMAFPASTHDDQIDALSQLLSWWKRREQHKESIIRRI